jgi:hypothetical protein
MAPLPPLPPESTRRAYIIYTSGGIQHTLMLRVPAGISAGTLEDALNEVIAAMVALMDPTDSVIRVDDSAAGSNIRFPLFPVAVAGTATAATANDQTRSAFISMTGKGTDGRLTSVSFYCLNSSFFVDTRVALGVAGAEWVDWYNAIDINSYGVAWRTIGGTIPTYNAYLNTAKSAYWQREQR